MSILSWVRYSGGGNGFVFIPTTMPPMSRALYKVPSMLRHNSRKGFSKIDARKRPRYRVACRRGPTSRARGDPIGPTPPGFSIRGACVRSADWLLFHHRIRPPTTVELLLPHCIERGVSVVTTCRSSHWRETIAGDRKRGIEPCPDLASVTSR